MRKERMASFASIVKKGLRNWSLSEHAKRAVGIHSNAMQSLMLMAHRFALNMSQDAIALRIYSFDSPSVPSRSDLVVH